MKKKSNIKAILKNIVITFIVFISYQCADNRLTDPRDNPYDPNGIYYIGLKVNAEDTTVAIYDTIKLYGETASGAQIETWEWKIGNNKWIKSSKSDTSFLAPGFQHTLICSLRVADKKGNKVANALGINIQLIYDSSLIRLETDDTLYDLFDTVTLLGKVSNKVIVEKWEWKTGINSWFTSSSSDTSAITPGNAQEYVCSLKVTNNYGTKLYASKKISTQFLNGMQVSSQGYFSMILKSDGTLWGTGDNNNGQLGDGTNTDKRTLVKITDNVSYVSAGGGWYFRDGHTMIIKNDGSLWAMGKNVDGQLGDGTNSAKNRPVKVMDDVSHVSAGRAHTMILKNNGTLWVAGYNYYGQLGDGTNNTIHTPKQLMTDVKYVCAGYSHTMIIKTDGTLWATGNNEDGQLGDGTNEDRNSPVFVMAGVDHVSVGITYTMILRTDRTLWATGDDTKGQFGDGPGYIPDIKVKILNNVTGVSAGDYHTLIIKNDGTVWASGENEYGQLGDGTKTTRFRFIKM